MKKHLLQIVIILIIISIAIIVFFVLTKPLNGAMTSGRYPTSECKCEGRGIFGRCWGELKDCVYLD